VIQNTKNTGIFRPVLLSNSDAKRQLLARSRYLLFKSKSKLTRSQTSRSKLLFDQYPSIEKAYDLSQKLSYIFENNPDKNIARVKLTIWYNEVEKFGFKSFNTISRTIQIHYETIMNYLEAEPR